MLFAGVGAALVGVMEQPRILTPSLHRHVERAQCQMPIIDGAERPADDEP